MGETGVYAPGHNFKTGSDHTTLSILLPESFANSNAFAGSHTSG